MSLHPIRPRGALALTTLAAALTACGGGSDSPAVVPVTPTPVSLTLTGVAATGRALAAAAVDVKCSAGTGTATTSASGSYTVNIISGSLPCIVKVTSGSTVLHSVATGSGSSASVNVSPLTELVLAQAAGGSAASLFTNFDAAAQAKLAGAALASATAAVATALQSVVALAGVNPFTDALVAASGGTPGNGLDAKLDTLAAALSAAQLTLPALGSAIVNNGAAAATVVATQLQPAAATCASLRSGPYRLINPNESGQDFAQYGYQKVIANATALTFTLPDGSTTPAAVAVADKPCHFSADGGRANVVVSPAGVLLNRYLANDGSNSPKVEIGFPEQTIPLADLAGTWNTVEFFRDSLSATTYQNSYAQVTFDAAGKITGLLDCKYLLPCTSTAPPASFTVNPAGGFDAVDTDGTVGRFFAYRAPSGDLMFVGVTPSGIIIASKQAALASPAVGDLSTYWDVQMGLRGTATDLTADVRTVTAISASPASVTRSSSASGGSDTQSLNSPRPGLRSRELNSCTTATGTATACGGYITMPLPGMGLTVYGSNVAQFNTSLGLQITRPAGSSSTGVQTVAAAATAPAASGTLAITGGEAYPLRVSFTINAAGQINGGQYDFHKLDGTMTACEHSAANDATCHGANASFGSSSQGGTLTTQGSTTSVALTAGPDIYGYTFSGTLTGTTWSGTFSKVATADSSYVASGSFSVAVVFTRN